VLEYGRSSVLDGGLELVWRRAGVGLVARVGVGVDVGIGNGS
jgi:hypothetical protein